MSSENQRFCPDCGSENVGPDFSRTNMLGEMIFNQNKWVCKECGYTGIMPTGEPDEDTEFKEAEEIKESHEINVSGGAAYFKYELYILIPLTVLYIIYLATRS